MSFSENLEIELKEFFIRPLESNNIDNMEENILSGKMYCTFEILESIEKDFLKYLPKYISGWNNKDLELDSGEIYFGVKDNGTIVGIPFNNEIDISLIKEKVLKTKDNMIGNKLDSIFDDIKIDLIEVEPIDTDMMSEYYKECDIYDKMILNHKKKVESYIKWHKEIMNWNCKIITILNNKEKKCLFYKWTEKHCTSKVKDKILESIKNWKYKSEFNFMVTDVKHNKDTLIHWLCLFKDITIASKKKKPYIPVIRHPDWTKFYHTPYLMNNFISQVNPKVKFYLIKITIPNKKHIVLAKNKSGWTQYVRVEGKLGPSSVPVELVHLF